MKAADAFPSPAQDTEMRAERQEKQEAAGDRCSEELFEVFEELLLKTLHSEVLLKLLLEETQ